MIDFLNVNFGFLDDLIQKDLASGTVEKIHTRFPPEPNGYLHIGHAKAIAVNFGLAAKYGGRCNLRFDDTNPEKEDQEYVRGIQEDIRWLGFPLQDNVYYASEYFEAMYEYARKLILEGHAYVCALSPEEMREYRGTLTTPGKDSPHRNRPAAESLQLFEEMRKGLHDEGSLVLRLRGDMASPNLNLRDPILYRILKREHHHVGEGWNIYPMYDYAHPIEDALEGISHSLCSLEFEDHRPLYDRILELLEFTKPPKQREFSRLNLTYTMMSKRKLLALVEEGLVDGWDDPRMPTLSGMRRRGYPREAVLRFVLDAGIAKSNSTIELAQLEAAVREELNRTAPRAMAVIRPLKVTVTNFPEDEARWVEVEINPEAPELGKRKMPFSRTLWIEEDDFMEEPVKGYRRLYPGNEVRFKGAYYLTCTGCIKDEEGKVTEVLCTYDPKSEGGWSEDGRKVQGTIHWVSAAHSKPCSFRLYDRLFALESPEGTDLHDSLNPESLEMAQGYMEAFLSEDRQPTYQFLRLGYFTRDLTSKADHPVFNRTATLKESFKTKK